MANELLHQIIQEALHEDINFNGVLVAVEQLVQPVDIFPNPREIPRRNENYYEEMSDLDRLSIYNVLGAYTTHNMVCRIALTNYDQMPEKLAEYCYVEFTMPATQVSHTTCRSVSLQNSDSDEPPEKYVRYLARHEYRVGIEHTEGESPNAYSVAAFVTNKPEPVVEEKPATVAEESSSDSD